MSRSQISVQKPPRLLSVAEHFAIPLDCSHPNKRQLLILCASRAFHRQGVNATGIAEIMHQAGVGKGQFYHYFGSKENFVAEVVRYLMDFFLERIAPFTRHLESLDEFESWFQPYVDFAELPRALGCPVGVIACEMAPAYPVVRAAAALALQRWITALAEGLAVLQARTGAGGAFQPLDLAEELAVSLQGALLLCRAMQDTGIIYELRDNWRRRLQGLVDRRE